MLKEHDQRSQNRLVPLDLLRGLIIVLMALDHANYFVAHQHSSGEYWGGPTPVFPSTLAFLTRLVTHYCAPGFFFLMGVGMVLFAMSRRNRGWSEGKIIQHFILRGALLILVQIFIVNGIWGVGPFPFPPVYIGVLFALGGGMILCSFLLRVKTLPLLFISLTLFIGTELLHPDPAVWNMLDADPLNLILLRSGGTASFWSNYPIIPWVELILLGIAFGQWLGKNPSKAYNRAAMIGLVFLVTFVVIRMLDGFGNIRPRPGNGWEDFFALVKYPPSMTFTLFTMGGNLLLLWIFSHISNSTSRTVVKPLLAFGRVPLFIYLLHLPLYLLLGRLLTPGGSPLGIMYIIWLLGLAFLYPLALWYGRFKERQPPNSILRFL